MGSVNVESPLLLGRKGREGTRLCHRIPDERAATEKTRVVESWTALPAAEVAKAFVTDSRGAAWLTTIRTSAMDYRFGVCDLLQALSSLPLLRFTVAAGADNTGLWSNFILIRLVPDHRRRSSDADLKLSCTVLASSELPRSCRVLPGVWITLPAGSAPVCYRRRHELAFCISD